MTKLEQERDLILRVLNYVLEEKLMGDDTLCDIKWMLNHSPRFMNCIDTDDARITYCICDIMSENYDNRDLSLAERWDISRTMTGVFRGSVYDDDAKSECECLEHFCSEMGLLVMNLI